MIMLSQPCKHLLTPQPELETLLVLDAHLQMADGFVRCPQCDAHYLLETVDLAARRVAYRISRLAPSAVAKTVQSLKKGSCDINRARNEVFSVSSGAQKLNAIMVAENGTFIQLIERPRETVPNKSWRDLSCDGTLLNAISS